MKVSERGQVTIPQVLREQFGFLPETEVEFVAQDGALLLIKKAGGRRAAVERLYGQKRFESSTDELMKLLRE
ncbi:MAG: AbrB/MazE/SpoVT family DNA-binding domain-containing protein [Truepera sp.]|nr:AbrB/MazE/SpoVT family DNA-binding domain-containing protein [Truepera sp.]